MQTVNKVKNQYLDAWWCFALLYGIIIELCMTYFFIYLFPSDPLVIHAMNGTLIFFVAFGSYLLMYSLRDQ